METVASQTNIYPCLYYDDASTAIEWLERVFGFKKRLVVPGENGAIMHAEMSYAPGVIMVASARPEMGLVSPRGLTGVNQGLCVRVEDADAHCARATSAGAHIVRELRNEEYGSRGYQTKDLEGNHWYFGTYRPGAHWKE